MQARARRQRREAEQRITSSRAIIGSGQRFIIRSRQARPLREARLLVAPERLLTFQVSDADNVDVFFDELCGAAAQTGGGVRSTLAVPFEVADGRREVLAVASLKPKAFDEHDLHFVEAVAHWLRIASVAVQDGQAADAAAWTTHTLAPSPCGNCRSRR